MLSPPTLFVSFSFADRPLAEQVVAELQVQGIDAWLCTEELRAGGTFDAQIQQAIDTRDHGLFLLSPASAGSEECHAEWRYVLQQPGHRLYVAQLVETPPALISYRLLIYQYADLSQNFSTGIASLAQAILANRDLNPDDPTTRRATRVAGELPAWQLFLPLIGRDDALLALQQRLISDRRVLVTGAGGVGKTKLALEFTLSTAFADGIVWFRIPAADSVAQSTTDLGTLTDLLREHLQLSAATDERAVWNQLGQVNLLLALDNAEDCQHPQPYLERLNNLSDRGGTAVLLTSRHDVPGLRHFSVYTLLPPDQEASIQILYNLVARDASRQPLLDTEAAAIAEAAYYNPRLLTAASPLLKTYPPSQVVTRLTTLRGSSIEVAVQEIIQHTLELMARQPDGAEALAALRKLVVCRGGFTLSAATALLDQDLDPLETLRAWSLLRFDGQRYSFDSLVLRAVTADDSIYPEFYRFYGELTLKLNDQQRYAELAAELENLESAFGWALQANRIGNAFGLVAIAGETLHNQGLFTQELDWLQRVEAALPADAPDELVAELDNCWGRYYLRQPLGDQREKLVTSVAKFERGLTFCSPTHEPQQYAAIKSNLGAAYWRWAQLEQPGMYLRLAISALEESIRVGSVTDNPLGYANTQDNLGNSFKELSQIEDRPGNLARAFAAYEEALRYRTPITAPMDYAHTQNNLGTAYVALADLRDRSANLELAIAAFIESIRYRTRQAAPSAYALTQVNLGTTYSELAQQHDRQANLTLALAAFQEALRVYVPDAYPVEYAVVQNNLGSTYNELAKDETPEANIERAIGAYEQALEYRSATATPRYYATTLHNLAVAYRSLSKITNQLVNLERALELYGQVLALRTREEEPESYALTHNNLGNTYCDLARVTGQFEYLSQAISAFEQALTVYTPTNSPLGYALTLFNLGMAYRDAGNIPFALGSWRAAEVIYQQQSDETMASNCAELIADFQPL
ncbi:toll/interleukin-1 receptor domain-containing protein [Hymenobacter defluvii]|uniref:Toll/interleukin-1 receptor domain-containing protein n=1 Tax=Hymenobacter defluvii TaxID=2054411 RepID=A0ABS3TIE8_9BACT|nr:toll/interleukin-1 receptor domain-containing protein [Hymenobacter defluvii]MBO3273158.1 toll/interleukin-1 receptor domain-containing protein [Hymenobacter defluvii]